jgi:hypothetical protein
MIFNLKYGEKMWLRKVVKNMNCHSRFVKADSKSNTKQTEALK